jgi:hypothetical protein
MTTATAPQTSAERQSLYRARRVLEGKTEVRGIYLLPIQHAELREYARMLAQLAPLKEPTP